MKVYMIVVSVTVIAIVSGCITQPKLTVSDIYFLSEFYNVSNFTELEEDVIGDDQTVIFYIEASGYRTKKGPDGYEFWIGIDITIEDSNGNPYIKETDDKEIHITDSPDKTGMVWYKYTWFTGDLVLSGQYTVKITLKDKLAGENIYRSREFRVDLSRN